MYIYKPSPDVQGRSWRLRRSEQATVIYLSMCIYLAIYLFISISTIYLSICMCISRHLVSRGGVGGCDVANKLFISIYLIHISIDIYIYIYIYIYISLEIYRYIYVYAVTWCPGAELAAETLWTSIREWPASGAIAEVRAPICRQRRERDRRVKWGGPYIYRERSIHIDIDIYVYICVFIYILYSSQPGAMADARALICRQRRESDHRLKRGGPHIFTYLHIYIYMYIYIYMCVCVYVYMYIYMYTYIYIYLYTHIYIYIHMCVYVHIHLYEYIYI